MKAPRNWGDDYAAAYEPMFAELAAAHGAVYYPFFLEGVAADPSLILGDGLHPNAQGVAEIVARILPKVEELIARAAAKKAANAKG
jgi:acyl-CoA thioesterase-1